MLRSIIRPQPLFRSLVRSYSAAAHADSATHSTPQPNVVRHLYYIQRTKDGAGSLPVYSEIRNTKYYLQIRNIQGNISTLAQDLQRELFPAGSPEAEYLKVNIRRNRHIDIHGGRWRQQVTDWLQAKGL
ncbi:hypothetical protein QCA50_002892 [Cerrena zonata]|uniref:Large ribosomal subunit protein mL49 n=1 Tax=Cerrena zonata TaxID=2478898 RepID=A0AAW0GV18_9APHY